MTQSFYIVVNGEKPEDRERKAKELQTLSNLVEDDNLTFLSELSKKPKVNEKLRAKQKLIKAFV